MTYHFTINTNNNQNHMIRKLFLFVATTIVTLTTVAQPLTAGKSVATDSIWNTLVKSVYLTPVGNDVAMPVLHMNDDGSIAEPLLLRFDIIDPKPENLRYKFFHCDADWKLDDLKEGEYFVGNTEGNIDNYQSSFTTRKEYTNYYQQLPEQYGRFAASGNYVLAVYVADKPDSILLTRRFYVYEDGIDVDIAIEKPKSGFGNVNRDQEVDVSISPVSGSGLTLQSEYYKVVVRQNGREDLTRTLEMDGYAGGSIRYGWKQANVFAGGNCFRYFDLSNLRATMYHVQRIESMGEEIFAFLQPEENRSRKVYTQYNSLNGGMKTNVRDRQNPHIEADYIWVNFCLPMERPFLNGNIHIVGDLTMWKLDDGSRMDWNPQFKAYTKRLLLKQGYYAYQLVFLPAGEKEALTSTLEGDHNVTVNEYTVFVYYRAPGSRYDRLTGFRKVRSDQE